MNYTAFFDYLMRCPRRLIKYFASNFRRKTYHAAIPLVLANLVRRIISDLGVVADGNLDKRIRVIMSVNVYWGFGKIAKASIMPLNASQFLVSL